MGRRKRGARRIRSWIGCSLMAVACLMDGNMLLQARENVPEPMVTVGEVSAILMESEDSPEQETHGARVILDGVRPGQKICKSPTVYLKEDSKQAYLRARFCVKGLSKREAEELQREIGQPKGWYYNRQDGYSYFGQALSAGEKIPVFESIHIPATWKDLGRIQIDIMVEAVQASQLTPRMDADCRMIGWILEE